MVEIRVFRFWVVILNLKGFVVGLDTPVRTTKGWIRTIEKKFVKSKCFGICRVKTTRAAMKKNQSMPEKADRRRQQGKLKKTRACRRRQIGEGSRGS
jgi:hypothetical protein